MLETRSKIINSNEYKVTQLPATKGSMVFVRLIRAFGPTLAALSGEGFNLAAALETLKENDIEALCKEFRKYSYVNDKYLDLNEVFDFHFAGKYLEMFQWLLFCLEVNYADFLDAIKAKAAGAMAKAVETHKSPSSSLKGVTGPSGDS